MLGLSITLSGKENATPTTHYDLPLLVDVIETVETYYIDKIDRNELIAGAIEGIFNKLDSHSDFLNHEELQTLRKANRGEYFGYGFEIAQEQQQIRIVTPFPHSPAERAGIEAGDIILSLNDKPVTELPTILQEIKAASIGKNSIRMALQHDNGKTYQVTLLPEKISIESVYSQLLDNNIGYVRLSWFQRSSATEMRTLLQHWQAQPLKALVLDLRNNPGGLLDQAIEIADMFLDKGKIVSTQGRFFDSNSDYYASPDVLAGEIPLLVLINKGSASAAEVLAGALHENHRATLMGQQSYGKGTVQSLIPTLNSVNAVKLTIAKYTTPSGNNIQSKGILPDILFAAEGITEQHNVHIIASGQADSRIIDDIELKQAVSWITQQH